MALEAARRHMERSAAVTRFEMKRPLRHLAVVAYVAPMVGAIGACAGVVDAFKCTFALGALAEGVLPLAIGLAVGIPVFWVHRHLNHCAEKFDVEMTCTSAEVIDYLRRR